MKRTPYEAAARCDFAHWMSRDGVSFPAYELVVDLDGCSLGLCLCEETGTITLLEQLSLPQAKPFEQIWLDRIRQTQPLTENNLADLLESDDVQDRMWNYYRAGGHRDREILTLPTGSLTCSSVDQAFQPVREALTALLEQGLDRLEQLKIPEEDLRVLAVGRLAGCAPARLVLRQALTFDPFLADHRFAEPYHEMNPGEIVPAGMALLEQSQTVGFDLTFLCLNDQGRTLEPIRLTERQQLLSTLETPVYSRPVFVCTGTRLQFQSGETAWKEELPYKIGPTVGDLVEVACGLREDKPIILLRRTIAPSKIYEITPKP